MSSDTEDLPSRTVIGISFGNSYSSIASTFSGDAQVIANEEGDRQIPTALSYVDGEEFGGTQAKAQLVRNAKNTVIGFKDYVGKQFSQIDPSATVRCSKPQDESNTVTFSLADGDPSSTRSVSVAEITTRHFKRLASSASDYLGRPVTAAVIAVPTDWTSAQKAALVSSAKDAGLEVLQLIGEPIAALLASDRKIVDKPADRVVAVAKIGGLRSDVAIISIRGGIYTVLATTHDYTLGGAQLDEVLMEYFAKEFMKKHKTDPRTNERGLAKLRLEAEATKKALSIGTTASFSVESLADGVDFSATVNRTRYDMLASKVYARFTRLVEDAVNKAELDVLDIDELLIAGGTAHTPRIAANMASFFPESTKIVAPSTDTNAINPSELIARGAALQALLIQDFDAEDIEQSTHPMVTVTPHLSKTVGLELADGNFHPLISAETPLPVRRTLNFTTSADGDSLIKLVEGEREIKVTKPEPKPKQDKKDGNEDDDDDEDFDDDEEDEEDETREKLWKVGRSLGELALKGVKKGGKVTLQVQIGADLSVSISAMEIGKSGVRGTIEGSTEMNGAAH